MKADRTVILIGVFLFLIGVSVAWNAYGYIQIERGWAMVISGTIGASAGLVVVVLGLALGLLQKIAASAAQAALFLAKVKSDAVFASSFADSFSASVTSPSAPPEAPADPAAPAAASTSALDSRRVAAAGLAGVVVAASEAGGEPALAPSADAPHWSDYAPKPPAWMNRVAASSVFSREKAAVDAPTPPAEPAPEAASPQAPALFPEPTTLQASGSRHEPVAFQQFESSDAPEAPTHQPIRPDFVAPVDPDSVFSDEAGERLDAPKFAELDNDWLARAAAAEAHDADRDLAASAQDADRDLVGSAHRADRDLVGSAHGADRDLVAPADFEPAPEAGWRIESPAVAFEPAPLWAEAAPEPGRQGAERPASDFAEGHASEPVEPAPMAAAEHAEAYDLARTPQSDEAQPSDEAQQLGEAQPHLDDAQPTDEAEPRPAIMGQYEANGARYIMYVDGSIDAETSHGVYRFKSMEELKHFIEQGV